MFNGEIKIVIFIKYYICPVANLTLFSKIGFIHPQ